MSSILPLIRLAKEDGLNTRLFNRRLSEEWGQRLYIDSLAGSFFVKTPKSIKLKLRLRGYVYNYDHFTGKKKKHEPYYCLDFCRMFVTRNGMIMYRFIWIDSDLSWSTLVSGRTQMPRTEVLEMSFVDPNRDQRKLRDNTLTLWMVKRKVNVFINIKDHHLFQFFKAKRKWARGWCLWANQGR